MLKNFAFEHFYHIVDITSTNIGHELFVFGCLLNVRNDIKLFNQLHIKKKIESDGTANNQNDGKNAFKKINNNTYLTNLRDGMDVIVKTFMFII